MSAFDDWVMEYYEEIWETEDEDEFNKSTNTD